nr:hypothetical protein [Burkholderia pyrrocinia]
MSTQLTDTVFAYADEQRVRCVVCIVARWRVDDGRPDVAFRGISINMLARDYVERELSHIQRMVALLDSETIAEDVSMSGAGRVRHPSYWRGRIEELLSTPDVPRHLRQLSEAVLAKIDAMELRNVAMR